MIRSSKYEQKFFETFNMIDDLVKTVNLSMSAQIAIITFEFLMFGLLLIFCSSISTSDNMWHFFLTSLYVHVILFQMSYLASSTTTEVVLNYFHQF